MHVILGYLHRIYLNIMVRRDLAEYFGHPFLNIASQDPFAILRSPYQMILGFVDCMACTLDRHAYSLLHDSVRSNFAILADSSPATGRGILRLLVNLPSRGSDMVSRSPSRQLHTRDAPVAMSFAFGLETVGSGTCA